MHKIVLFIEPSVEAFETPSKIGHIFMNRFTIEEDASFEIAKVLELGKIPLKSIDPSHPEYEHLGTTLKRKGMKFIPYNIIST